MNFEEAVKVFGLTHAIVHRNINNYTDTVYYHNNTHMDFVLEDCITAFFQSRIPELSLLPVYKEALFYAAIFHDCNHSGGFLTDDKNIENAIQFFCEFINLKDTKKHIKSKNLNRFAQSVVFLLRTTQYPYLNYEEIRGYKELQYLRPLMINTANVLRDADLMTSYHGDHGVNLITEGLYKEFTSRGNPHEDLTYEDYVQKQTEFLNNIKWHSPWGEKRAQMLNFDQRRIYVIGLMNRNLMCQKETV